MQRFLIASIGAIIAFVISTEAFAHAFLDKAVPGVGATVNSSPNELELHFSQDIVPAFSGVQIAPEGGAQLPAGKAILDAASPNTLHLRLSKALKPGTYIVSWHVVSVDTHPSSGTYKFTVSP